MFNLESIARVYFSKSIKIDRVQFELFEMLTSAINSKMNEKSRMITY